MSGTPPPGTPSPTGDKPGGSTRPPSKPPAREVPEALTPREVAERLRTTEWWVRKQARDYMVPHLRMGRGRIAFLPEHVQALAKLAEVQPVGKPPVPDKALAAIAKVATSRSQAIHRGRQLRERLAANK